MADLTPGNIPKALGPTTIVDSIFSETSGAGSVAGLLHVFGDLSLHGATSGALALRAPGAAGNSVITFPVGTTNFAATGGAGQVLQQATLGGPITVGVLTSVGGFTAGSVLFAGAAGTLTQDNANLFFNDTTNRLTINGLDDGGSWDSTGPSQDPRVVLYSTYSGNLNAHGFRAYRQFNGTGLDSSYNDFDAFSTVNSAGTSAATHYAGFQARPNLKTGTTGVSGATLPMAKMFQAIPVLGAGTTVDKYYSYFSQPNITLGNANEAYAYYAAQMTSLANPSWATTRYAFYSVVDPSHFGGAVDIGSTSYANGLVQLNVMNAGALRFLVNLGTAPGGGGLYVAGLAPTGILTGRPTIDNAQIVLDRHNDVSGGGIEFINSGATSGYSHKITSPGVASGTAARGQDLIFYARQNSVDWTETLRIAPNGSGVGISNSVMGAVLAVGTSVASFRVYNAVTDASNTEWFQASWSGGVLGLGTNMLGTGLARDVNFIRGGVQFLLAAATGLRFTTPSLAIGADGVLGPTAGVLFRVGGGLSTAGLNTSGVISLGAGLIVNDTGSSGTVAVANTVTFPAPTINASNAVTFSRLSTVRFAGAPIAGTNVVITAGYALEVANGESLFTGGIVVGTATLLRTTATLSNGAAAGAGTLTNAPVAGNPTKWIAIDDNGTIRRIPAW